MHWSACMLVNEETRLYQTESALLKCLTSHSRSLVIAAWNVGRVMIESLLNYLDVFSEVVCSKSYGFN